MRPIDADALMPKLKIIREAEHQIYGKESWGFASKCITAIEDAPTIESERKMGKWIDAYPDIEPNPMFMYAICSVGGYEQAISNKLNFCPDCGSDMRQKEGESK